MSSDSELDEFYDAVDETPDGSFLQKLEEANRGDVELDEEEKELLELKRKQEERRRKEDEELQEKIQYLLQKKKEEQLRREEEERKEQLERRRRKHEDIRRRMISQEGSLQEISTEESDVEELADELDDAEALNRSLEKSDKFSECYVNINSSQPEKDKQNKEVYHFVDSGNKVDTIDHNFVPYSEDVVDGVFPGNYAADDENEPDIVKSTKTRTPPNTLQSVAHPPHPVQELEVALPKLRIQSDIITKSTDPPRNEIPGTSTQQIPEAVITPPSPTFQQPVAPPRKKKKMKMSSSSSNSQVEQLTPPHRHSVGSSVSSISEFDFQSPESPGLPSENQDIPADFEKLTQQLEHTLDLRTLIRGQRHVNAEEAEMNAVNSDYDSPNHTLDSRIDASASKTDTSGSKTDTSGSRTDTSRPSSGKSSKTSSLDREGKKSKNTSLDRASSFDKRSSLDRTDGKLERKKSKSSSLDKDSVKMRSRNSSGHEISPKRDLRPRSGSGKPLTDEEILEGFIVKNLDTGETTNLKDAEKKLPKCVDPLVLHIIERTKDYPGGHNKKEDYEYETRSDGGTVLSKENIKKKGSKLKKLLKKKVDKAADKMKTAADQGKRRKNKNKVAIATMNGIRDVNEQLKVLEQRVIHGDDQDSVDDEISDEGRRYKFKAKHNRKGPWEFGQLKLIQDLGDHTGAIWVMKFSPCGRLLATGGQDTVLRIWVLKSAFNHFDDMRQKYAETSSLRVTPAPSTESLDSIPSISEVSSMELGATAETEESKKGPFKSKPFCKYRGHSADLLDISWSKNYFVLSSSMDKTVRLWHISRRECLCSFQHIDFVTAIVFHPKDDRYFLSGSLDGKLRLWNIPDKKVTLWNEVGSNNNSLITTANFCHNGKFAVVGTYDGKCIFYSTEHLKYYTQIHVRSTRGKNARGHKITCIEPLLGEDKVLVTSNDSRVRLYDLRDLTLTCKYKGHTNSSSQIRATFSPKGKYVISGSEDHFIYIWKTQHEFDKFSSVRRDRNDYYEAVKVHNAVVTAAVFAPHPSQFLDEAEKEKLCLEKEKEKDSASKDAESKAQFVISADFSGCIKIIRAK